MGPVRGFGSSNHNNARYVHKIAVYICRNFVLRHSKLLKQISVRISSICLLTMIHSMCLVFCKLYILKFPHTFRHSREKVNRTVFVEGIACDASVEDIARFFAVCGVVVAVRVSDTCASSRRAWVEYETRDGAIAALEFTRPVRQHRWECPV